MSATAVAQSDGRFDDAKAGSAALAVADGLTEQGLDVRDPAREKSHILKVTSARGLLCEVAITESGLVTWEYLPFGGSGADPGQIAEMIMSALGADESEHCGVAPRQYPELTLKGSVACALREQGMQVGYCLVDPDDVFRSVYSDIEITNPAKHGRGAVLLDNDGIIRWECRISGSALNAEGIEPAEIAGTIARTLAFGQKG